MTPSELGQFACPHEVAALRRRPLYPVGIKVSTMVSTARIHAAVDFETLREFVARHDDGFVLEDRTRVSLYKKSGGFVGQCTLLFSPPSTTRTVNMKIFHNGSLQLTGIDVPRTGLAAIHAALLVCKRANALRASHRPVQVRDYQTVNINSNFTAGFKINQMALYEILSLVYGLFVIFDKTHYPGVNMKFFSNTTNRRHDGVCRCTEPCRNKKGKGYRDGDCRRITVSLFQAGSLIRGRAAPAHGDVRLHTRRARPAQPRDPRTRVQPHPDGRALTEPRPNRRRSIARPARRRPMPPDWRCSLLSRYFATYARAARARSS